VQCRLEGSGLEAEQPIPDGLVTVVSVERPIDQWSRDAASTGVTSPIRCEDSHGVCSCTGGMRLVPIGLADGRHVLGAEPQRLNAPVRLGTRVAHRLYERTLAHRL